MACENCLAVGDVVVLNAGGPFMTVTDLSNTHAECSWFAGDSLHRADFAHAAVAMVGDDDDDDDEMDLDPLGYPVCRGVN